MLRHLILPVLLASVVDAQGTRLLRHPAINGNSIAFAYAGDLWVVGRGGGSARRLTSTPEVETDPQFSPDGSSIALYRFLRDSGRGVEVAAIATRMGEFDPAAVITAASAAGECALCELTVERFASIFAAEAGNLALKANATGGVFIGGGIAPNIIAHLRAPAFVESFRDKGRMRPLLEAMPLAVITNADAALLGAVRVVSGRREQ